VGEERREGGRCLAREVEIRGAKFGNVMLVQL